MLTHTRTHPNPNEDKKLRYTTPNNNYGPVHRAKRWYNKSYLLVINPGPKCALYKGIAGLDK